MTKVRQGFSMATMGKDGGRKTMSYLPREGGEAGDRERAGAWVVSHILPGRSDQGPVTPQQEGTCPLTPL